MKFDIITIFPNIFSNEGGYFFQSIIKRAQESGIVEINVHNLRDYTTDKHKTVDDTPYGGGAGMVLKVEPIFNCIEAIKNKKQETRNPVKMSNGASKIQEKKETQISNLKSRRILFSAKGKRFTQKDAERLSKYDNLILICGRYEGVDERVAENLVDEEISIGDYVLTGGEIPAMIVVDSITRLLPGVLGNDESAQFESHSEEGYLEHPQYTKPENFNDWSVPEVLLGGNHSEIEKWRKENSKNSYPPSAEPRYE